MAVGVLPDGSDRSEVAGGEDVTDRICATLSDAIVEGALRPGVKLSEEVIAEHFGVSRTVVRAALGILQRDRLIDRKRNRGAFVAEPTAKEAAELLDARRAIERAIIDRVVPRAGEADLARLDALTREEERIHRQTDEAAKSRLSGHFHLELAKLADNGVLVELLEKVVTRISLVMAIYDPNPKDHCGAEDHRRILAAIRSGDAEAARNEMDQHLQEMTKRLKLGENQIDPHSLVAVLERFSVRM